MNLFHHLAQEPFIVAHQIVFFPSGPHFESLSESESTLVYFMNEVVCLLHLFSHLSLLCKLGQYFCELFQLPRDVLSLHHVI